MNPSILKLGIVVVLVGGSIGFLANSFNKKSAEAEHRLDLERIRREYLERAPIARVLSDPTKARNEQQQLFKWYLGELTDHYNHYQSLKDYDRFMVDLKERKRNNKVRDPEFAQYEERYKVTRAVWDSLLNGKYDPVFSASDNGLRLEIYEVKSIPDAKEPKLRLAFALHGAQRKWTADTSNGTRVLRLNVNASFHELLFSGLDADGKQIRKMSARGDPFKIDNPERFIEEFPPEVVLGYYDVPKIPDEVVSAELTFDISTRSMLSGEELAAKFVWKQPVPADWKLPPGVNWEGAEEQVREEPEPADAAKRGASVGRR